MRNLLGLPAPAGREAPPGGYLPVCGCLSTGPVKALLFGACGAITSWNTLQEPIQPLNELGGGLFGQVHLAQRCLVQGSGFGQPVAVKLPRYGGPMDPLPILAMEFNSARPRPGVSSDIPECSFGRLCNTGHGWVHRRHQRMGGVWRDAPAARRRVLTHLILEERSFGY